MQPTSPSTTTNPSTTPLYHTTTISFAPCRVCGAEMDFRLTMNAYRWRYVCTEPTADSRALHLLHKAVHAPDER